MPKISLAQKLLIALLTLTMAWLAWPASPAKAEEPTICYSLDLDFASDEQGFTFIHNPENLIYNLVNSYHDGTEGALYGYLTGTLPGGYKLTRSWWELDIDDIDLSSIDSVAWGFEARRKQLGGMGSAMWLVYDDGTSSYLSSANITTYAWYESTSFSGDKVLDKIRLDFGLSTVTGSASPPRESFIRHAYVTITGTCGEPPGPVQCSTVSNADFTTTDLWTLASPTASIDDGKANLAPGDAIAQILSLSAGKTYIASITAEVVNPAELVVGLGFGENSDLATLNITASGVYTTKLTTPANLFGGIAYTLLNHASDTISIDYTCLSLDTSGINCIAPVNGDFDSAGGWEWHRGAQWSSNSKNAYLPYNQGPVGVKSLIVPSDRYDMPTLDEGKHLLLSFSANTDLGQSAMLASLARGTNAVEYYYEIYQSSYNFEADISSLAGETDVYLAWANSGNSPQEPSFAAEGAVHLDNICIWVANRSAALPGPTDPGAMTPVNLDFGYTSCLDVDGYLAYFGVNMAQYRAVYLAGAPGWLSFGDWVPWLVAAFWNVLETYLCIFMGVFNTLVRIIEHLINNFLNIGNWAIREWRLFVIFLGDLWPWVRGTVSNFGSWFGSEGYKILFWYLASGSNLLVFAAFLFSYGLSNLWHIINWLSVGLLPAAVSREKNTLVEVTNWIIAAWNLFVAALGPTISAAIETLLDVWSYLVPFLEGVFTAVTSTIAPVFLFSSFISAVWNLFWMLLKWIWANGFMMVHSTINFYYAFNGGVADESFAFLLTCENENFWCGLLAGIQMVNQVAGQSIMYPIVIVGIIIGTILIFWKYI